MSAYEEIVNTVYAILLSLIGVVAIIFNRMFVEVAYSYRLLFIWFRPPVPVARAVVVLAGLFFVVFGLLMAFGFLQ